MNTVTVTTHHIISLEELLNGESQIITFLNQNIDIVQTITKILSYIFTSRSNSSGKQKIHLYILI